MNTRSLGYVIHGLCKLYSQLVEVRYAITCKARCYYIIISVMVHRCFYRINLVHLDLEDCGFVHSSNIEKKKTPQNTSSHSQIKYYLPECLISTFTSIHFQGSAKVYDRCYAEIAEIWIPPRPWPSSGTKGPRVV